jgi:hypothetical protein
MLRSILFDITFLSFGGALLISTINVQAGLISLAIAIVSALPHSATNEASHARLFSAPVGLRGAVA